MKNNIIKFSSSTMFILALLLSNLLTNSLNAQKNKSVKLKAPPTTYLKTSFDMSLEKIPLDFKGHNPVELFKNLDKKQISLEKSEFETNA